MAPELTRMGVLPISFSLISMLTRFATLPMSSLELGSVRLLVPTLTTNRLVFSRELIRSKCSLFIKTTPKPNPGPGIRPA